MAKVVQSKDGKKFLVNDATKDYHTQFGVVSKDDLEAGGIISTNTGKVMTVFDASFVDLYQKIKRGAQIVPLKDLGLIIAETGIGKDSVVVDAGAGSGALACFLAHIAKKVTTFEIRDDFAAIVQKNIDVLGLKNITLKKQSIYEPITEKNVDVFTLDVPEPWSALETAKKALKHGGFIVSYSPTIPQVMDFVSAVENDPDFSYLKTCEIIERQWDVSGRKVRPKSQAIGHSGFLTFVRKL